MSFTRTLLIMVLAFSLFECRKNVTGAVVQRITLDTIYPLSYYPVYPGSFWTYLNQNNDTAKYYTLEKYMKNCFSPGFTDTVYVPFIRKSGSEAAPIYQYDEISRFAPYVTGTSQYQRTPILSETVNKVFKRGGFDARYGDHRPFVRVRGKFLINNDSVLILKGSYDYTTTVFVEHYTKNIGLTWYYQMDTITMDTAYKLRLISYKINH